jgi:hypothetical protein
MENRTKKHHVFRIMVHWIARIMSIISIGLVLLFMVGEGFNPAQLTPTEWSGFLFFPGGISIGMIIAWWKEGVGGSITIGSLIMFYVVHIATSGKFPHGWAWLLFASPGFLFLVNWYQKQR